MGILDDAIREHLELKRQHGAGDEDLERLENEAFGPAARPGDPEFATGEESIAATSRWFPSRIVRGSVLPEPIKITEPSLSPFWRNCSPISLIFVRKRLSIRS